MAEIIQLVLERDGHDQPWGFRLQGGADLAMPLSVQRVLLGTPADGTLFKGDIITKISSTETKNISHQQAADLFNSAGNQITVHLKRTGKQSTPVASSSSTVNGSPAHIRLPLPVSGGVPLPGIANTDLARPESLAVRSLPKTPFSLKSHFAKQQKAPPTNLDTLSIQTQPYRTTPLLQPSAKVQTDLGKSAISHLGTQEDYFMMPKESQFVYAPQPQVLSAREKQEDFRMKQKVRRPSEALQSSVVGLGEGEEEREGAQGLSLSCKSKAKNIRQLVETFHPHEHLISEGNLEDHSKKTKKEDIKRNGNKIGKNTFNIGGEVVQLKKPPENSIDSNDINSQNIDLIRHSLGNVLRVAENDPAEVRVTTGSNMSSKRRTRSLDYTVYTTQVEEEPSDQIVLNLDNVVNLSQYLNAKQEAHTGQCTLQVVKSEAEVSSTVEVEHTIKLSHMKPKPEVQSVDVFQTVRIQTDS